jgi:hypothetical protein
VLLHSDGARVPLLPLIFAQSRSGLIHAELLAWGLVKGCDASALTTLTLILSLDYD